MRGLLPLLVLRGLAEASLSRAAAATPAPEVPTWTPRRSNRLGMEVFASEHGKLMQSGVSRRLKELQLDLLNANRNGTLDYYNLKKPGWVWANVNKSLTPMMEVAQSRMSSERASEKVQLEQIQRTTEQRRSLERQHLRAISTDFNTAYRSRLEKYQLRKEQDEARRKRQYQNALPGSKTGHKYLWETLMRKKLLDRQTKALDAVKEGGMGAVKGMFVVPARNTSGSSAKRSPSEATTASEEWARPHEVAHPDDLKRHLEQADNAPDMLSRALRILHNFWFYKGYTGAPSKPQYGCTGPKAWCNSKKSS